MATTPRASGYLAPSGAVVFPRRLPLSREEAWAAVTDPARTARWIGSWSGDPASGTVEMTMSAEEGSPAESVAVLRCEAPDLVVVRIGPDGWVITVRIEGDDDEVTRRRSTRSTSLMPTPRPTSVPAGTSIWTGWSRPRRAAIRRPCASPPTTTPRWPTTTGRCWAAEAVGPAAVFDCAPSTCFRS